MRQRPIPKSADLARSLAFLSFSTPAIMDLGSAVNGGTAPPEKATDKDVTMTTNTHSKSEEEDIDPIWLSSRTARQIYGLCQVEKVSPRA